MTFSGPLVADPDRRILGLVVTAIGLVVLLAAGRRVLPPGTHAFRPGLPSVIALRFVTSAAFAGVGGLIPLMLVQTAGVGPALAGASLSVTGVFWALGSALNGSDRLQRVAVATRVRAGLALIALGSAGPVLLATGRLPLAAGLALWALSATGIGLVSPALSTELLALAPPGEHGRAAAAQSLAISMGVAVPTGLAGTVIALGGAGTTRATFAALMAIGTVIAAVGTAVAHRVSPGS